MCCTTQSLKDASTAHGAVQADQCLDGPTNWRIHRPPCHCCANACRATMSRSGIKAGKHTTLLLLTLVSALQFQSMRCFLLAFPNPRILAKLQSSQLRSSFSADVEHSRPALRHSGTSIHQPSHLQRNPTSPKRSWSSRHDGWYRFGCKVNVISCFRSWPSICWAEIPSPPCGPRVADDVGANRSACGFELDSDFQNSYREISETGQVPILKAQVPFGIWCWAIAGCIQVDDQRTKAADELLGFPCFLPNFDSFLHIIIEVGWDDGQRDFPANSIQAGDRPWDYECLCCRRQRFRGSARLAAVAHACLIRKACQPLFLLA